MSGIEEFKEAFPSLESYWRSIILFGRNVASYKFALAKSILEIAPTGKAVVTLDELADPFSRHLCQHLKTAPKQATSRTSQFLEACQKFNNGEISHQALIDITVEKGFNNVIDAFHIVNYGAIPIQFYKKDYSWKDKKIILTDDVFRLQETPCSQNFTVETESRWNLVETAWRLGVSRNLLYVRYDEASEYFVIDEDFRRRSVTSARGALNGYQKGKCFYCFDEINVSDDLENNCDVDHFFPHSLQTLFPEINFDGVWNLVLACKNCNRGADGKFAKVPAIKYLQRLNKRNEFLISSHHPLRETIMSQTGMTEDDRRNYLLEMDKRAINALIHRWETEQLGPATF